MVSSKNSREVALLQVLELMVARLREPPMAEEHWKEEALELARELGTKVELMLLEAGCGDVFCLLPPVPVGPLERKTMFFLARKVFRALDHALQKKITVSRLYEHPRQHTSEVRNARFRAVVLLTRLAGYTS